MNAKPIGADWVAQARCFFASGATRSAAFRIRQLRGLEAVIAGREAEIWDALKADLGKPAAEACMSETGWVLNDIRHARRRLKSWIRSRRRSTPPGLFPARSRIDPQPRGVVLILAPWNYPFQLLFSPLVDALAAGNVVCLKPSEHTPSVSRLASQLVQAAFAPEVAGVFEGDGTVAASLLENRFDHIFFTGGLAVGRKVMAAAARFPTPVTLELGGKSPCMVCADTDARIAARRIAWGKFMNAGQTCVAPDYVLVERAILPRLLEALQVAIREFFGADPRASADYGRVVNDAHFRRLAAYLNDGTRVCGGETDPAERYVAPTILLDPPEDSAVMQEEIFGPILPVLGVASLDEALARLRARPAPLAMYLFSQRREAHRRVRAETRSGGLCINDTLVHLFNRSLPFGGFGESGFGAYHGRTGFDTFTHHRAVVVRRLRPDPSLRYPPPRVSLDQLRRVARWLFP